MIGKRGRVRTFGIAMRCIGGRTIRVPAKTADPIYTCASHREWRKAVLHRAGGRCEAVDKGVRCEKALPAHRMFADHRLEVKDGGARLDPANGQCLCGSHHGRKTARERANRRGGTPMTQ